MVNVNDRQAVLVLDGLISSATNQAPAWRRIAVLLEKRTSRNFREGGDGRKRWKPLKPATISRKKGTILRESGRLEQSVKADSSRTGVSFAADAPYAEYVQEERPFMVIHDEDVREIEELLVDFFVGEG